MSHIEKMVVPKEKIKLENNVEFDVLCVKPSNIDGMDWNHPDNLKSLLNQNFYVSHKVNPTNFVEKIAEILKIKDYEQNLEGEILNVTTQIVAEEKEYIYEISYLELPNNLLKPENENQMSNLINVNDKKIFGNVIMYKTYLPLNSNNMLFHDMKKEDLHRILYDRANTKIVTYNDEVWSENRANDIQKFADDFFEDDKYKVKKIEIPFLGG